MIVSIDNHPNLHVINTMLEIEQVISDNVRGKGLELDKEELLEIAKELAEKAEELVDNKVSLSRL